MAETIDYSERLTRAALRELPDGEWSFEDWIDDDGIDVGKPIRLFVTMRKKGDSMVVDWTGTSPQVQGRHQQHAVLHQVGVLLPRSARCCRRASPTTRACSAPSR